MNRANNDRNNSSVNFNCNINGSPAPTDYPLSSLLGNLKGALDKSGDAPNNKGNLKRPSASATTIAVIASLAIIIICLTVFVACNVGSAFLEIADGQTTLVDAVRNAAGSIATVVAAVAVLIATGIILALFLRHRAKEREAERAHRESILSTPLEKFSDANTPNAEELAKKYETANSSQGANPQS